MAAIAVSRILCFESSEFDTNCVTTGCGDCGVI